MVKFFQRKQFSNTQVLSKIKSKTNVNRQLLFYEHVNGTFPNYGFNISSRFFTSEKFYPINAPKSSYTENETITFEYLYECDHSNEYSPYRGYDISVSDSTTSFYRYYYSNCSKTLQKDELSLNIPNFTVGSKHKFRYRFNYNQHYLYPFTIRDKSAPDIVLYDDQINYVQAGSDFIIEGKIMSKDDDLNATFYTIVDHDDPVQHRIVKSNDTDWHHFSLKVSTKNLIKSAHTLTIYACQNDSQDFRSNIIYFQFVVSSPTRNNILRSKNNQLDCSHDITCDPNNNAKYFGSGSLVPSLIMGGLSMHFS